MRVCACMQVVVATLVRKLNLDAIDEDVAAAWVAALTALRGK